MAGKYDRNRGKPWTREHDRLLKSLWVERSRPKTGYASYDGPGDRLPVRIIALKLARTSNAIRSRVCELTMSGEWRRL